LAMGQLGIPGGAQISVENSDGTGQSSDPNR
jgi:hypothetical protein